MKEKKELLSLKFFAVRFGFCEEDLSYGVAHINGIITPVILVKNKQLYIHITDDCLRPKELPRIVCRLEECSFSMNESQYIFKTKDDVFSLEVKDVEKFYSAKYYSEATEKYVTGWL